MRQYFFLVDTVFSRLIRDNDSRHGTHGFFVRGRCCFVRCELEVREKRSSPSGSGDLEASELLQALSRAREEREESG